MQMSDAFPFIFFMILGGIAIIFWTVARIADKGRIRRANSIIRKLSDVYGLEKIKAGKKQPMFAAGKKDGYRARVYTDFFARENLSPGLTVNMTVTMDSFPLESFRAKTNTYGADQSLKALAVKTHDTEFDRRIMIASYPEAPFFAHFDSEARLLLDKLAGKNHLLEISCYNSEMTFTFNYSALDREEEYLSRWELLKKFITCLSGEIDVEAGLRKNYFLEKHNNTRIPYLEALGEMKEELEDSDPVIADALASDSPRLVFEAVKYTGRRHFSRLEDVFLKLSSRRDREDVIKFAAFRNCEEMFRFFMDHPEISTTHDERMLILDLVDLFDRPGIADYLCMQLKMNRVNRLEYDKRCIRMLGEYGNYSTISFLHGLKIIDTASVIDRAINAIQNRIGSGDSGWLSTTAPDDDEGRLSINAGKSGE